jgi:serine/threonine protein kinase
MHPVPKGLPDEEPRSPGNLQRTTTHYSTYDEAPAPPDTRGHHPGGAQSFPPEILPRSFGNYELLEEIARGGMGVVYKARQIGLDRTVALKRILTGPKTRATELERFQREARAAAALDHPNIVPVYDNGRHEGHSFFTMALIDGPSLADLVRSGPLPPAEAVRLTRGAAEGVAYAHAHGILHRDLKPHNVLVDPEGRPRVTDFGLVRRLGESDQLTAEGQVLGTPSYMAPEQARGDQAAYGPATDVYGLGAVLYHLLTGRPPFENRSTYTVLHRVTHEPPPPLRHLNPEVPELLEFICLRCLEKEPSRRYLSAKALVEALDVWADADSVRAPHRLSPGPDTVPPAEAPETNDAPETKLTYALHSGPMPTDHPHPAPDTMPASPRLTTSEPSRVAATAGVKPPPRRRLLFPVLGGILAAGVLVVLVWLVTQEKKPGGPSGSQGGAEPRTVKDASEPGPGKPTVRGQQEDDAKAEDPDRPAFPPPPFVKNFEVGVQLFEVRGGKLVESRLRKDGVRLVTAGELVLRIRSARKARVGIYSVAADGTIHQLLPNEFERDNQVEADVPRDLPAARLRDDYALELVPSAGTDQLRVLATTGDWPKLDGRKAGPFLAFRDVAERRKVGDMRDVVVKRKTGFTELMVPFVVEKDPGDSEKG